MAYRRAVDSASEKAQALQIPNPTPGQLSVRYKNLVSNVQAIIGVLDKWLDSRQRLLELVRSYNEWSRSTWAKVSSIKLEIQPLTSADRKREINERLSIVNEQLESASLPHGLELVRDMESAATALAGGREEKELANAKFDYDKLTAAVSEVKLCLEEALKQWAEYEHLLEQLVSWLNQAETTLKLFCPKNSLEEKETQLATFRDLDKSIQERQEDVKQLETLAERLDQLNIAEEERDEGRSRVGPINLHQLLSRFQAVQALAREVVKSCQQASELHKVLLFCL